MKQGYFAHQEFRKYLLYAIGEMALLIIGILIALQIDNWNTAKKDRETLENYLKSIARNIAHDLVAIDVIREKREAACATSIRAYFLADVPSFSMAETAFAHRALTDARELHSFTASTTAYEALKSSGNLDQLQGSDIEVLLYDYYDAVNRIAYAEQNHNEHARLLWLQLLSDWPEDMLEWEIADPAPLAADRFQALQPSIYSLINNRSTDALHRHAQSVGPLILDYEKLRQLGGVFIRMVENDGAMNFDEVAQNVLDNIYDPNSPFGYPNIIVDGRVSLHTYFPFGADANDVRISGRTIGPDDANSSSGGLDYSSIQRSGDSLLISYPGGTDWAGVWFGIGDGLSGNRRNLDFSAFDKLLLEIKGDRGGERIFVNLEDNEDPLDGSSTRYELRLTDQWQTYEIDLAEFVTADLNNLRIPLGFVFPDDEALSFKVKTARYLDAN